ncbi:MAG TPA: ABC transporter permease [Tepidisphaeraceae bacterium]
MTIETSPASLPPTPAPPATETVGEKSSVAVMSQWQLIRRAFAKHKLAVIALHLLIMLYLVAIFAEFCAPSLPGTRDLDHSFCPPQLIRWSPSRGLHVYAMQLVVDPITFRKTYVERTDAPVFLSLFAKGGGYYLWGLIPFDRHILGLDLAENASPLPKGVSPSFYFLGADKYGRDILSRIIYGSRISLSVGLVGITITFILGMTIGGISGYVGGRTDLFIQRVIEVMNSFPQLPLWIALGAVMPQDWSALQVYFAITVVLALLGWTSLARVVRGKILSLREEDYAMAARLSGASHGRILMRHLLPGFTSHIIVALSLSVPTMILGETSLSFLGLGLRPPIVSWGVMLQDCMDIQAVTNYKWMLLPVLFIVSTVLCFNFVGDGLRDAADPYSSK